MSKRIVKARVRITQRGAYAELYYVSSGRFSTELSVKIKHFDKSFSFWSSWEDVTHEESERLLQQAKEWADKEIALVEKYEQN